jgi:glycosyltransferase involved in cell wall biosynthesis
VNILILGTQVPFVHGGAEVLVDGLADALADRGHLVDIVQLPLAWNPVEGLLTTALAWRMLDLTVSNGVPVDRVICTKYPTWAVAHPRKSLWLVHQHRQVYDLHGGPMSEFTPDRAAQQVRERVIAIDRRGISECVPRYGISGNVVGRLKKYSGINAAVLYPPVPRAGLHPEAYEPFVLSVARLDAAKRVGKLIEAWPQVDARLRLVIASDGPERRHLEGMARRVGIEERVQFLGRVSDAELAHLYNTCRAVYYAPIDEDYGYAAVEALAAAKPVLTAPDSGGVLEFVAEGERGIVTELYPAALAAAVDSLVDERTARALGAGGPELVAPMTWETVVSALLAE